MEDCCLFFVCSLYYLIIFYKGGIEDSLKVIVFVYKVILLVLRIIFNWYDMVKRFYGYILK